MLDCDFADFIVTREKQACAIRFAVKFQHSKPVIVTTLDETQQYQIVVTRMISVALFSNCKSYSVSPI